MRMGNRWDLFPVWQRLWNCLHNSQWSNWTSQGWPDPHVGKRRVRNGRWLDEGPRPQRVLSPNDCGQRPQRRSSPGSPSQLSQPHWWWWELKGNKFQALAAHAHFDIQCTAERRRDHGQSPSAHKHASVKENYVVNPLPLKQNRPHLSFILNFIPNPPRS